jgi:hypothetical protein
VIFELQGGRKRTSSIFIARNGLLGERRMTFSSQLYSSAGPTRTFLSRLSFDRNCCLRNLADFMVFIPVSSLRDLGCVIEGNLIDLTG